MPNPQRSLRRFTTIMLCDCGGATCVVPPDLSPRELSLHHLEDDNEQHQNQDHLSRSDVLPTSMVCRGCIIGMQRFWWVRSRVISIIRSIAVCACHRLISVSVVSMALFEGTVAAIGTLSAIQCVIVGEDNVKLFGVVDWWGSPSSFVKNALTTA